MVNVATDGRCHDKAFLSDRKMSLMKRATKTVPISMLTASCGSISKQNRVRIFLILCVAFAVCNVCLIGWFSLNCHSSVCRGDRQWFCEFYDVCAVVVCFFK